MASIYMVDIVSAIEISVLYDMIPQIYEHDMITACWDMMVYYCNESKWYQDKIYQYYMMYQYDMIYQQYDMTPAVIWYISMTWHESSMI